MLISLTFCSPLSLLFSDAHIMWDPVSGKSRGFGFAVFREKADAEQAIATMNGEWLGTRAIRCNWATQKGNIFIYVESRYTDYCFYYFLWFFFLS